MADLVKDVLACWSTKHHKDVADGWHMKWRCRGRLIEFKLLMLTAVSTVWTYDVPRPWFIHHDVDCNEVESMSEVLSLPIDVNLVV